MPLSPAEQAFVELDAEYPAIQEYYERREAVLADLATAHGVGHAFQDDTGRVHQIVTPQWKTVKMEHIGVISTARKAGDRNDLSAKKAMELGFTPRVPE